MHCSLVTKKKTIVVAFKAHFSAVNWCQEDTELFMVKLLVTLDKTGEELTNAVFNLKDKTHDPVCPKVCIIEHPLCSRTKLLALQQFNIALVDPFPCKVSLSLKKMTMNMMADDLSDKEDGANNANMNTS